MLKPPFNVLFLCTHNSARSIMAEALLNHVGQGRFKAYSAGSTPDPEGKVHPLALRVLRSHGINGSASHSKSWDTFDRIDAPLIDIVLTVCNMVADKKCPKWPNQPVAANWFFPDPTSMPGSEEQRLMVFESTFKAIERRLGTLLALPMDGISKLMLADRLADSVAQT
jgi:arsenate reductase (thioredoxin)